ncbi:MAG: DUF4124 domain-containing protein [Rhodocyclaceae bacterium]|nr:DUF4124 domain-containing protein [Rhodocyclaceae bacterium]
MNARLFLATALLIPLPAVAQIYEYKDAAGRTVYTDQPPPSGVVRSRAIAKEAAPGSNSSGVTTLVPKTAVDRELEFKKRQKEAREQAAKSDREAADKHARKGECARAKLHLQALESGERLASRDDQGERVFLDDDQRKVETTRARKAVNDLCK